MSTASVVEEGLNSFKSIYNPSSSLQIAKNKSIYAALQRNPTYRSNFKTDQRKKFRLAWEAVLNEFISKKLFLLDEVRFIKVALHYRDCLKKEAPYLNFKLSHTQKSLSLYAKHCWALDIISEPMICPVDRMILVAAKAPVGMQTWTKIDSEAEYLAQFTFIRNAAQKANMSIAQWELLSFLPKK